MKLCRTLAFSLCGLLATALLVGTSTPAAKFFKISGKYTATTTEEELSPVGDQKGASGTRKYRGHYIPETQYVTYWHGELACRKAGLSQLSC